MKKKYIDVNIEIYCVNSDVLSCSNGNPFDGGHINIGDVFFDERF